MVSLCPTYKSFSYSMNMMDLSNSLWTMEDDMHQFKGSVMNGVLLYWKHISGPCLKIQFLVLMCMFLVVIMRYILTVVIPRASVRLFNAPPILLHDTFLEKGEGTVLVNKDEEGAAPGAE
ncbi:uncharacterized protein LOC109367034 isoform X3 [Meleagris gallopavo]|uniref:uncharacterized protein LOC109367034 isoform X3 n=1 Tax=Meleagris gallopavo TaxID=9103 RepID=UPI00093CD372|nr:uncharacterized protein LOC109367034 isoform X3 [Meleagris gallopavo]